jgi:hypothetical protein
LYTFYDWEKFHQFLYWNKDLNNTLKISKTINGTETTSGAEIFEVDTSP